ncbi:hypothetical protein HK104_001283, partial [Borealophlyctis nickersoniae]
MVTPPPPPVEFYGVPTFSIHPSGDFSDPGTPPSPSPSNCTARASMESPTTRVTVRVMAKQGGHEDGTGGKRGRKKNKSEVVKSGGAQRVEEQRGIKE